jgi:enediyne biosynthesis protein E4
MNAPLHSAGNAGSKVRKHTWLIFFGVVAGLFGPVVSNADMFTRITTGPGAIPNGSSAVAWGDFNNDGWLDLFVTSFGGTTSNYCYTNNGDGTFTRVLPTFFPASNINSYGCAWADYDNDGYLDLVKGISNPFGGSTQVYRNNHDGTFNNVTASTIGNIGPGANNVIWGDYDNDGHIDLFQAVGYNAPDNILLHNRGNGSFNRITGNPMVTATGLSSGASWGDYDNDGRLDLLVARTSAGCLFYHNEGGGVFQAITNQPFNTDTNGAGVSWGDYDNDGLLDVFVAHPQSANRLYHNNGGGNFSVRTNDIIYQARAASSGGAWADYDNDGWLDLFVANAGGGASFLFHNDGDGKFTRITNGVVVTDVGTGQGAAWGDYDNDGFSDLIVPNVFTYNNFLYRNNGNTNAWLTLKLEGRLSNRAAIGAKVRAKTMIGGSQRWQLREISGGGSLGSQNDLRASFGLADATNVDLVRIEWPSGVVQELRNLAPRQFLTVIEPEARITPVSQEVPVGTSATFTVSTTTLPPFDLQWRLNGTDLPGETNTTLVITNTQAQHAGSYSVTVFQPDTGLGFNSPVALLTGPVVITQHPRSLNARPGSNVLFSVIATGISPVRYQWRFNETILMDATNATLVITNAQFPNVGSYDVLVANGYGAVWSMAAELGMLVNPAIMVQPLSQSVAPGGNVTFSVAVTGSPAPFTFEWRRGSLTVWTNVTPEPASFFTITNVQPGQVLTVRVVIKNAANFQPGIISGTAAVTLLADTDGDGLPDEWESAHGLQTTNADDAILDTDGDGINNRGEHLAGTDPEDPQSFLRIESVRLDNTPAWRLQFLATSNRTYSVQAADDLTSDATWRSVADLPAAPTNRTVEIVRPIIGVLPRFLRLVTPQGPGP